jgi:hypothetical protein
MSNYSDNALRLEEFDRVAGWILDEDLAAARSLDGLTAERRPLGSETLNSRVEIGNDDLESIPASGLRNPASLARAAYARLVEKQSQVILRQTGESRGTGKVHMKAEAIAVEVDRLVDVCDEVPHSRLRHLRLLRFVCWRVTRACGPGRLLIPSARASPVTAA